MLERAHRGGVPSSSVALLLALSCTSEPAEGEGGLRDLPPIDWKGRFIEFGTDVDTEICPSTLPAMDEYMEGVDEHVRSNASYPVRYYYLQEQLTHYGFGCGDDAWGCARYEHGRSIVGSTQLSLRHELIHASTTASRHRLLEEGLAVDEAAGAEIEAGAVREVEDVIHQMSGGAGLEGVLEGLEVGAAFR